MIVFEFVFDLLISWNLDLYFCRSALLAFSSFDGFYLRRQFQAKNKCKPSYLGALWLDQNLLFVDRLQSPRLNTDHFLTFAHMNLVFFSWTRRYSKLSEIRKMWVELGCKRMNECACYCLVWASIRFGIFFRL